MMRCPPVFTQELSFKDTSCDPPVILNNHQHLSWCSELLQAMGKSCPSHFTEAGQKINRAEYLKIIGEVLLSWDEKNYPEHCNACQKQCRPS